MSDDPRPVDAMIVGAQKAGTSSLLRYVSQHPAVLTHGQEEMVYFIRDEEYRLPYLQVYDRYFSRNAGPGEIVLAKNVGVMFSEKALDRLREHNPECRVIVSLRNPIDRAYSAFWYMRRKGWETEDTFEAALALEDERVAEGGPHGLHCAYVRRGLYADQLAWIEDRFGSERCEVVLVEDLIQQPVEKVAGIFRFMGIDDAFVPDTTRRHNPAGSPKSMLLARSVIADTPAKRWIARLFPYEWKEKLRTFVASFNEGEFRPPPMEPETRSLLVERFRPENERLGRLLGRDLSHWNR